MKDSRGLELLSLACVSPLPPEQWREELNMAQRQSSLILVLMDPAASPGVLSPPGNLFCIQSHLVFFSEDNLFPPLGFCVLHGGQN